MQTQDSNGFLSNEKLHLLSYGDLNNSITLSTLFIRFGGTYGRPRMHLTKAQNGPLFLKP